MRLPEPMPTVPAWTIVLAPAAEFPDEASFELALSIAASLVAAEPRTLLAMGEQAPWTGDAALGALATAARVGDGAAARSRRDGTRSRRGRRAPQDLADPDPVRAAHALTRAVEVVGPSSPEGWTRGVRICADPTGRGTGVPGELVVAALSELPARLRALR